MNHLLLPLHSRTDVVFHPGKRSKVNLLASLGMTALQVVRAMALGVTEHHPRNVLKVVPGVLLTAAVRVVKSNRLAGIPRIKTVQKRTVADRTGMNAHSPRKDPVKLLDLRSKMTTTLRLVGVGFRTHTNIISRCTWHRNKIICWSSRGF